MILSAHYAFPENLLEQIYANWGTVPAREAFALPSRDTLRQLLETCYHASLRTAEHRTVSCVVAYAPIAEVADKALLQFGIPVRLTDSELARLSPVTQQRQTLIGCDYVGRRLRIWGLFEYGRAWLRRTEDEALGTSNEADAPPDCLTVAIEGPGALSVARGQRTLVRLREGQVVLPQENPLRSPDNPLGMFFHELLQDLQRLPRYKKRITEVSDHARIRTLLDIYTSSVAAILERIRANRHGGSILISREPLDDTMAQITYTLVERRGLADEIVSYYEALSRPPGTHKHQPRDRSTELSLRNASYQMLRDINQISLLTGVDGAVLLDDHLRIRGFGVRFPVLLPPGETVIDADTGFDYACDEWGLRHQSIFSICQRLDHAVGLIVSQDGGVKAVKAVNGKLHLWNGILD